MSATETEVLGTAEPGTPPANEPRPTEPVDLPLAEIKLDPELACRAKGVNKGIVREYALAMKAGSKFPPVTVFKDPKGVHWLADGFHRCGAAEQARLAEISAEVRQGGRREALLYAAQANGSNGLRRSSADKRRAVELVLKAFPKWSDRKIADATGVDHKTVARVKDLAKRPAPDGEIPQPEEAEQALLKRLSGLQAWVRARAGNGAAFALAAEEVSKLISALEPVRQIDFSDGDPAQEPKPARRKRGENAVAEQGGEP